MTASDDFIPGGDPNYDTGPNYPVVFGITLTPAISGLLLALFGLGATAYLLLNLVQPAWQRNQELEAKVKEKNDQLAQQGALLKQIETLKTDLETAKKQRQDVLSLFANESTLNTLVLDLNRQIDSRNAGLAQARQNKLAACPASVRDNVVEFERQLGDLVAKAQLKKFIPVTKAATGGTAASGIITDGSYGPLVNNKLKRQVIAVSLEGNFNQTEAILRSIERLQPLLVLKNVEFVLGGGDGGNKQIGTYYQVRGNTIQLVPNCQPEPKITTSFQLEALLPLSPEEAKAIAPASPTPPPKK